MEVSDLIGIGRLGGMDAQGFFQVLIKPRYRPVFEDAKCVFLIFKSDRVFYVTISERKVSDKKIMVRFVEDGIDIERRLHREVLIALEPEFLDEDEGLDHLLGYEVLFEDRYLGTVKDYFHNHAQYVLVIGTPTGKELLVPYVDHYVQAEIPDPGVLLLQSAQPLIDALESDS